MERVLCEDYHWWFASRTRALKAMMDRLLPQTPDFRLLDVGCGAGNMIHHLSHYGQVKGIEIDPRPVKMAHQRGYDVDQFDATQPMPFVDSSFDAVTALDVMASKSLAKQPETSANEQMEKGIIRTKRSITVQRPVDEVYAFWHDFQNLPRFMRHLESVRMTGEGRSHWVAKAPAGKTVEWDAETTEDRKNEVIAWRSLPGSKVYNAGEVRFSSAPGDRGTELRVMLDYDPPFGKLGSKVAMLWREEPGQQIADDLRHFKQVMETGEIVLSDSTKRRGPHPAKPDDKPVQL